MNQERWRSPIVWAAIGAQIVAILLTLSIIPPALGERVDEVTAMVLQLLVLIGVLNNPTNHDGF